MSPTAIIASLNPTSRTTFNAISLNISKNLIIWKKKTERPTGKYRYHHHIHSTPTPRNLGVVKKQDTLWITTVARKSRPELLRILLHLLPLLAGRLIAEIYFKFKGLIGKKRLPYSDWLRSIYHTMVPVDSQRANVHKLTFQSSFPSITDFLKRNAYSCIGSQWKRLQADNWTIPSFAPLPCRNEQQSILASAC